MGYGVDLGGIGSLRDYEKRPSSTGSTPIPDHTLVVDPHYVRHRNLRLPMVLLLHQANEEMGAS